MIKEQDVISIKKKWEIGVSINRIIRSMPCSTSVALATLKELRENGTLPPRERKKGVDLVAHAYKSGIENPYELAKELGYTYDTVVCYLNRAGISRRRPSDNWKKRKPSKVSKQTQEIIELLNYGKGVCEIARMYGITKQRVSAIKKRSENNE